MTTQTDPQKQPITLTSVLFHIRNQGFASADELAVHFNARNGPSYEELVKVIGMLSRENLIKAERGSYRVKITAATCALMHDARTEDELVAVFMAQEGPREKGFVRSMVRSALRTTLVLADHPHIPAPYLASQPFAGSGTA